jgi:hypothetical protein
MITPPDTVADTFLARMKTTRFLLANLVGEGGLSPEAPIALLLDALVQDARPVCDAIAALRERVEKAGAENADLQAAFDLQWAADQRARELWCAAHPGNDLVWPDRARLVLWLMERAERLDWLAAQGNDTGWIARSSSTGRGYRLHQPGPHPDPGSAIDAARAPSTPSASTEETPCAHCGDEKGNSSCDDRIADFCPACALPVCAGCLSASSPTHCGSFSDDWPSASTEVSDA